MRTQSNIFRVRKMRNSDITHLVNKQDSEEFYVFDSAFKQNDIDDRDYHRRELLIVGRSAMLARPQITHKNILRMAGF